MSAVRRSLRPDPHPLVANAEHRPFESQRHCRHHLDPLRALRPSTSAAKILDVCLVRELSEVPSMGTITCCSWRHFRLVANVIASRTASGCTASFSSSRNAPSLEALEAHAFITVPAGRPATSAARSTSRAVRRTSPSSACPNSASDQLLALHIPTGRSDSREIQARTAIRPEDEVPT